MEYPGKDIRNMKKKRIIAAACVLALFALGGAFVLMHAFDTTDIPKLYLEGDISGMESKEDEREIAFRYDDGKSEVSGYAKIKVQGTSSLEYEKKNYTLKFYGDAEYGDKLEIDVGWGPQSKYCMKANWIDKTHARNVVTAKLAGQMQEKYGLLMDAPNHGAIDGFPVEIHSNGKFLGLYTFNIPKDAWQFGMDEDNPDHIVICGDDWYDETFFKAMPDFSTWEIEVGEESDETLEKMNRLFDFVINATDEEFGNNFHEYLNLDAALNYYVMSDIAYLIDNRAKNMLIATYDGMEWYLSLYDLDTSWGTDFAGQELWPYKEELVDMDQSNLFARMERSFPRELAERYYELRADVLSDANIMKTFHEFRETIPELTLLREKLRWKKIPGYDYEQIEDYLQTMPEMLDAKYAQLMAQE